MTTYTYRIYKSNGTLLYVGITNNLTVRFANHKAFKHWWHEVARFDIRQFETREEALREEALAIVHESPEYNEKSEPLAPKSIRTRDGLSRSGYKSQPLPPEEVKYLRGLKTNEEVYARAAELYRAGWTMKALTEAVRIQPTSAQLKSQFVFQPQEATGRALPEFALTSTEKAVQDRKVNNKRKSSYTPTTDEIIELRSLFENAKRYRPQHPADHPYALAREAYIGLIRALNSKGMLAKDIAAIVGVNESNIRRKL